MSHEYIEQLRRLVHASIAMRETTIVDDDFPRMLDRFDSELRSAEALLRKAPV